ncbi:hypothetical protein DFR29_105258 [Tahibacter aquaticus]|uniref:Outer membrane repeat protein n=1 Tax=Tahibacter aquaticus TaxID=520092 RepID=A0A4R6Z0M3_9GAMM|nr:choice-of-anchor Q domain-containing protein [Tahibacter aquaticus]TDR45075.1 hypothetical protein DFR29_105258 [Tahibacter aquaticus]
MSPTTAFPSTRRRPARRPLALCLAAALLAVPAVPALAANLPVANCNDSGSGSLRAVIATAGSGDTVDLSALACSSIALTSGTIDVGAIADLTIAAAAAQNFAVSGAPQSRLFQHTGTGWLSFDNLNLGAGHSPDSGGCVFSQGSVRVTGGSVTGCSAGGNDVEGVRGGAIAALGDVSLDGTRVADSRADGRGLVLGGGVYAGGTLRISRTQIAGNTAHSHLVSGNNPFVNIAQGGGVHSDGNLLLDNARISGNSVTSDSYESFGGGISAGVNASGTTPVQLEVLQSVISGNSNRSLCDVCAPQGGGGIVVGMATIDHSEISGNTVGSTNHYGGGGGFRFFGSGNDVQVLDSVISGNEADSAGGGLIGPGRGRLIVQRSRIENNTAHNDAGLDEGGGGILGFGVSVQLLDSSVTGNISGSDGAGVNLLFGEYAPESSRIDNSTISGNTATNQGGGVFSSGAELNVRNSTIAFNNAGERGAGISADSYTYSVDLQSSIIANNATAGAANNVWTFPDVISGAKNIVPNAPGLPGELPADTLAADPLLLPLVFSEGMVRTRVHAFASASPALNAGSNTLNVLYDTRGWPFVRAFGTPDIGAYEEQPNTDRVFADAFEG